VQGSARSGRPAPVWNPAIRQWWIPPVAAETAPNPSVSQPAARPQKTTLKPASPRPQPTPHVALPAQKVLRPKKKVTIKISVKGPSLQLHKHLKQLRRTYLNLKRWQRYGVNLISLTLIVLILVEGVLPWLGLIGQQATYALSDADKTVISKTDDDMASVLKHDVAKGTYNFNEAYDPLQASANKVSDGGPVIQATLHDDSSKGVTVTDPVNQVDFTITPQFGTLAARQDKNQLRYPINVGRGALVYTADASGVKEDILLRQEAGDTLKFTYKLGLDNLYAAKILDDGSLAIYGTSLPLGNVNTSTDQDAALLQKARQHAKKDKLLFILPPPVINEDGQNASAARAHYKLDGDKLTVVATKLKTAKYPLSIDPTVQISTNSEFYRNTSIESNADFDTTNNKITRGALTGGTTGTWTATSTMNQARFLNGAVAYNGFLYVVGGAQTNSTTNIAGNNANMVEYTSISTSSPSTLGTWAAGNNTNLPTAGLSRFQLIGYHGFLYAIGGSYTDTTCGTVSSDVYYSAVQVNGVLGNWTKLTSSLATGRCSFGATAYGNKLYIAGGKTGSATGTGSTDVSYASVNPDGTLTWTSGTTPALPAARYGNDLQAYNGYLYVVGGMLSGSPGTLTNTVLYDALKTDGSIFTGSWTSTNAFTTARENFGTVFTVIKNGYIYLSGGCSSVNANQSCATQQSDTQLAQINADGSLGQWATTTSLIANGASAATRAGTTEVVWRGTIYNVAGCASMNTGTISCATNLATSQYATITTPGQASVLKTTTTLPTTAGAYPNGVYGAASVVMNGFIYVVGGCLTFDTGSSNGCQQTGTNTSAATSFAPINTDGTLGSWTTDTTHTVGGANGLAETALVAANGVLYAFGGWTRGTAGNSTIWTVTPNANGTLPASWAQNATGLRAGNAWYAMSAMYFNGAVYTFGGCHATTTTFGCSTYNQDVVKYAISGTTITAGVTTNLTQLTAGTVDFPNAAMGIAFYYGYVYLCGGANSNATANGGPQTSKCVYNKLSSAGTMTGAWSTTSGSLNQTIRRGQAYASNGYLYVYSGHNGQTGNSVGDINIGQINSSTGDVASFSLSTTSFTAKWDTASAFADGNIYTVGGCTTGGPPTGCTVATGASQYFQIYNATNSGTRNITSSTAISGTAVGVSAAISGGYLYIAGGCNSYTVSSSNCSGAQATVQYAAINPDGSLPGTLSTGTSIPNGRGFGCMVALHGYLYYIAGASSGSPQPNVYTDSVSGGTFGTWTDVAGNQLPSNVNRQGIGCATYNDRIYVTGGQQTNATTSTQTTVYYSGSLPTGGNTVTWSTASNVFTTARSYHATVAAAGYLYVIGGFTGSGTTTLSDVQYSQLDPSTGAPGTWSFTQDIPIKIRQMQAFAANGYIYVLGGDNGTNFATCFATTFVAAVNSTGDLGAWTQGVATSFTAQGGMGLAYDDGYYYLAGGNDCSNNLSTTYYGGEQSQAIRSIFTRYIDLVGDATPQKFVVNGTNAVVNTVDIEKWRLTYNSSRIATNAFGASTVITPLSFGSNPVAISAIDGSSVNQGVSRYWLLAFDIDQTQSFAFIDSTQPAIISYSWYYSPAGNTRLRNGRQFQDQTKQSLDAHP